MSAAVQPIGVLLDQLNYLCEPCPRFRLRDLPRAQTWIRPAKGHAVGDQVVEQPPGIILEVDFDVAVLSLLTERELDAAALEHLTADLRNWCALLEPLCGRRRLRLRRINEERVFRRRLRDEEAARKLLGDGLPAMKRAVGFLDEVTRGERRRSSTP